MCLAALRIVARCFLVDPAEQCLARGLHMPEPLAARRWAARRAGRQHRDGRSRHIPRLIAIDGKGVGVGSEAAVPAIRQLDLTKGIIDGVRPRAAHDTGKADTNLEAIDAQSRAWRPIFRTLRLRQACRKHCDE